MKLNKRFEKVMPLAAALLFFSASTVHAQAPTMQKLPTTQEGLNAVAQNFANCSGHWSFVALIAKREDRSDAATTFEDVARGWSIAGMILLAESLPAERETETEELFNSMVESKVTIMKEKNEADPVGSFAEFAKDYKASCAPWVETQKKIIELMRRG